MKIKKALNPESVRNENEKLFHEAFKEFVIDFYSISATFLLNTFRVFLGKIPEFGSLFPSLPTHKHIYRFFIKRNFNFLFLFHFLNRFFCLFPFQGFFSVSSMKSGSVSNLSNAFLLQLQLLRNASQDTLLTDWFF